VWEAAGQRQRSKSIGYPPRGRRRRFMRGDGVLALVSQTKTARGIRHETGGEGGVIEERGRGERERERERK